MKKITWQVNKYLNYAMEAAKWFDNENYFLDEVEKIVLEMNSRNVDLYFAKRFKEIKNTKYTVGYSYAISKLEGLADEEKFEEIYDLVDDYIKMVNSEKGYVVSQESKGDMIRELGMIECRAYCDEASLKGLFEIGLLN